MTLLEEVRSEYKKQVDEHLEENREAALKIRDILAASPVNYGGVFDKTVHIPKVYDKETIDRFQEIAGMTHRIFEKVIDAYQNDPEYRKLFPFSKELEELMCLPIPYDSKLPMARFDLFYYEDTTSFTMRTPETSSSARSTQTALPPWSGTSSTARRSSKTRRIRPCSNSTTFSPSKSSTAG